MLKRWWRYIVALLSGRMDKSEDLDTLLSQAQRELIEFHTRNRDQAVQAIRQKKHLQQMMDDTQERIDSLEAQANRALESGDTENARQLWDEKLRYEMTLTATRQNLDQAIATVEEVKAAIRREEERIGRKLAERRYLSPLGGRVWLPETNIAPLRGWLLFLTILTMLILLSAKSW